MSLHDRSAKACACTDRAAEGFDRTIGSVDIMGKPSDLTVMPTSPDLSSDHSLMEVLRAASQAWPLPGEDSTQLTGIFLPCVCLQPR